MDYSPRGHRELDMTEQLAQAQGGLRLGGEEAGLQGCLRQSSCYLCIPGCVQDVMRTAFVQDGISVRFPLM